MLVKNLKRIGLSFIVLGLLAVLHSSGTLTGYFILEDFSKTTTYYFSFVFLISGIFLYIVAELVPKPRTLAHLIESTVPAPARPSCTVLLDADVLKQIQDKHKSPGGEVNLPSQYLKGVHAVIPERVYQEATHISNRTNQPLVSRKTINYLQKEGVSIEPQRVSENKYRDEIVSLWHMTSPQGRRASSGGYEESRFSRSGDVALLSNAMEKSKQGNRVIIVTNNYSEIGNIAQELKKEGYKIDVKRGSEYL